MAYTPYTEHIEEHKAINKMFNVDCDNIKPEEHLKLHLEYKFRVGKITEEQYKHYKFPSKGLQEKS